MRRPEPIDTATLSEFLGVLASPVRLELLGLLRLPHTLREVRVAPQRGGARVRGGSASRQTIHAHLQKLVEHDLVRTREVEQEGRRVPQYAVNPSRFYALIEELRRLSTMYASRGLGGDATGTLDQAAPGVEVRGPRLLLVHGVYEGKVFPLDEATARDGGWTIGRRAGLPVCLDYDPFVSLEHAVVERRGASLVLTDLPRSKNGTAVMWRPLPSGGSWVLRPGDVVGVGRSLLCYADS